MMTNKPVRWTSPANAWATGAQLIAFVIPVLAVLEVYQPVALEAISVPVADMWQWLLFVAAGAAVATSITTQVLTGRSGALMLALLRLEAAATLLLSLCMAALWGALVHEYGFAANPLTQLLVGGLGLAAAARVVQIVVEVWRYRRALREGKTATLEALAQPKES